MFIDEECGHLKIVVDGGELNRNINKKKKYVLIARRCPILDKCYKQDCFFLSMWNVVNELGEHGFSVIFLGSMMSG